MRDCSAVQVTKEATTHLAFHPTTDTLIVACAGELLPVMPLQLCS